MRLGTRVRMRSSYCFILRHSDSFRMSSDLVKEPFAWNRIFSNGRAVIAVGGLIAAVAVVFFLMKSGKLGGNKGPAQ